MKRATFQLFVGCCILLADSSACLWDRDTLAMEKARFPEAAALIAGNFPRHSKEFYEWRKSKAEEAIKNGAKEPGLYDDLAVAKHKLGDHSGAIETMKSKEKIAPGLYETYSNLGTFYIYTGELDAALKWIDKALAINPNAHFGREVYQRWLVEWVKSGTPSVEDEDSVFMPKGFAKFIQTKLGGDQRSWKRDQQAALKGILGMMRFADFDNPLLTEALGDVLSGGKMDESAIHLAAQAYLQASRKSAGATDRKRIGDKLGEVGVLTERFKMSDEVKALDAALAEGTTFAANIRKDEIAWIRAGKDASAEFEKKYLKLKH